MFTWFDNLRIRTKLLVGFFVVLVPTALVGAVSIVQLNHVSTQARTLATNAMPRVKLAAAVRAGSLELRSVQYAHMLSDSEQEQATLKGQIKRITDSVTGMRKAYEPLVTSTDERAAYENFSRHWDDYLRGNEKVLSLTGDFGTKAMGGDYQKLFDAMSGDLATILQINERDADAQALVAEATAARMRVVVAAVVVANMVFGLGMALGMARRISRPLSEAASSARAIAKGDLTRTIPAGGNDEVGQLLKALAEMQGGLCELVSTVRTGVESVATASSEIASGNLDLSVRTEEQASNLQRTASAIHQMAGNVRQNTESAQEANRLALSATEVAVRGGDAVHHVVQTMDDITVASRKIVDIIGVIDGIAFQTNILALNAAVEAARAGEQGRGFAVVASEVRSLAQRSATAAKEIKTLIGASVDKVESGAKLVQGAGQTMNEIVASVQRVSGIIGGISGAASEQTHGITQINEAVSQLDEMTQRNSALVEQGAAAAESLREQGHRLNVAVASFQLR